MAIWGGDRESFVAGFVTGLGAGVTFREIVPTLGSVARPLVKSTIKSGYFAFEKSRETMAHMGESIQDILAEAKSEVYQQQNTAASQHKAEGSKNSQYKKSKEKEQHQKDKE